MFWKSEGTNEHLAYRVNFSGENILKYFSYFPRKYENRIWHFMQFVPFIGFDISYKLFMQIVSLIRWYFMQIGDNLYEMSNPIFSEKFDLLPAEFALNVLSVIYEIQIKYLSLLMKQRNVTNFAMEENWLASHCWISCFHKDYILLLWNKDITVQMFFTFSALSILFNNNLAKVKSY